MSVSTDIEGPGDTHDDPAPLEDVHPDAPVPVDPDTALDDDGSVTSVTPDEQAPSPQVAEPIETDEPDVPATQPSSFDHDATVVSTPLVPDEGPAPHAPYDPSGRA